MRQASDDVRIGELHAFNRPRFAAFTFPYYQPLVSTPALARRCLFVGAWDGQEPVGLALAENGAPGTAHLRSLCVAPGYRRRRIGLSLLAELEALAARRGIARLETVHMATLPDAPAFEGLLKAAGWSPPATRMFVLRSSLPEIMKSSWMRNPPVLEPEFALSPWEEVSPEEKQKTAEAGIYSPEVWPDNFPADYDRPTSMAVRRQGELVGWIVNHPKGPGLLRFTCSYLRDDLQGRARMVAVMAESVRRMEEAGFHSGIWTVPVAFPRMVAFARRRLFPFATEISETRGSGKELTGSTPAPL